jgi:hypothetical protein
MLMHRRCTHVCLLLASGVLAACGGGSETPSPATGSVGAPLAIDANNYVDVGKRAARAGASLAGASDAGTSAAGNAGLGKPRAAQGKATAVALDALHAITPALAASGSRSLACPRGGSLNLAWNLRLTNGPSVDDTITIDHAACADAEGGVTNGRTAVQFTRVGGGNFLDGATYDLTLRMTFTGYSSTHPTRGTDTVEGTLTVQTQRLARDLGRDSASTPFLTSSATVPAPSTSELLDFAAVVTHTPLTESATLDGTLNVREYAARSVIADTVEPFVRQRGEPYPARGQATFTGQSGSRVTMTALSTTQVRFDLDNNGDGLIDASTTVNWVDVW